MVNKADLPLLVIGGPTGVGKTDLSLQISKAFNGEIINGDSLQFYRGLDIGTGKIRPDEMQGQVHHLLNILDPNQTMDAFSFKKMAQEKIEEIHQRGKFPILVGGTGLYLEGLLFNLTFGSQEETNLTDRQTWEAKWQDTSNQALFDRLVSLDPLAAHKIPLENRRRLLRALQVIEETGKLFSSQDQHQKQVKTYRSLLAVLDRHRPQLYDRINRRVDMMLDEGLEEEARNLFMAYQGELVPGAKGIGYKEWWPYFEGQMDFDTTVAQIKQNSRRYAKRQLTWFRNRFDDKLWVQADQDEDLLFGAIEDLLKN